MLPDHLQPADIIGDNPPSAPPSAGKKGASHVWAFKDVQEDLVEARRMWMRAPGGGASPFAGDGPWDLISESDRALEAELVLNAAAEGRPVTPDPRPLPLTRAEVAWMHQVSEWLLLAPERDRQLIAAVLGQLARGAKRVSWSKVRARLRVENSERGLGMRYSRAVTAIAQELTRRRVARSWAEQGEGAGEELLEALLRVGESRRAAAGPGNYTAEWLRQGRSGRGR